VQNGRIVAHLRDHALRQVASVCVTRESQAIRQLPGHPPAADAGHAEDRLTSSARKSTISRS
jgi:hypothetical protein